MINPSTDINYDIPLLRLVLATRNLHKASELKLLLNDAPVQLTDLSAFPDAPLVDESGVSLQENASKKALSAHTHTGLWALGDDTGLYIRALDGMPGLLSARFAGEHATSEENRALVLDFLANKSDRTAKFVTVLALASPQGQTCFEGSLHGHIATSSMSREGFGYESIFVPDGFDISLAQMSREEKNRISHRAQSASKCKRHLHRLHTQ